MLIKGPRTRRHTTLATSLPNREEKTIDRRSFLRRSGTGHQQPCRARRIASHRCSQSRGRPAATSRRKGVRNATGNQDRVLFYGNKAAHQVFGKHIDILLQRNHIRPACLVGKPTPKRLKRPHIGNAGLLLDGCMHLGDGERFRRGDVPLGNSIRTPIGLAPLSLASTRWLAATACSLSGTWVGEPIPRFKVGVDQPKAANNQNAEQAVKAGAAHHPGGNPGTKASGGLTRR